MRRLGILALAVVACGAVLSAASARSTTWNLTGTWIGQDQGVFVVRQSGTTVTWYGHSADKTTWAHDFRGTLEGDYVVGHFQDRAGYANRFQGDLVVHITDNNHFEWAPSYAGVTSLGILTRSWTRVSSPAASTTVDVCSPSDCSALAVKVDPTLDPGQTTLPTSVGCSGRGTSSAAAAQGGCIIDAVISAVRPLTSPLDATTAKGIQDALKNLELLPDLKPNEHELIAGLLDDITRVMSPATGPLKAVDGLDSLLQKLETSPADSTDAQTIDTELNPLVPPDQGRLPAGIKALTALAPKASAVIASIQSTHPSAADARAYIAAVKLGTAVAYSPGRAAARLELLLAEAFGGHELARELTGKPPTVIATSKATIAAKARRNLSLKASTLGARVLRLLGVRGLSKHNTTVRLQVTSTNGPSKHTATKLLTIR